jgi:hypothetical protein
LQHEAVNNAPKDKESASRTVTSNVVSCVSHEPADPLLRREVSVEHPLLVTRVVVRGVALHHGDLKEEEVAQGVRIAYCHKRISEASTVLHCMRRELADSLDETVLSIRRQVFQLASMELEPEERTMTEQAA